MILSIGMIVKNEEKYLHKCLQALLPILNQVKSELIIIDTGSTDNSVEIAREFTDKVYNFDWCDDFAAARNEAMKRAKGEWYMSLDADEIFEDPKELIGFFNSGEYKKYNSGALTIRSSNKIDSNIYTEINSCRLVKINDDSYFINAVHERFENIYYPVKSFTFIVNHYGYVIEDNYEYVKLKTQRNLKLMFKELEKDPIFYLYISQAYRMLGEYENALEYTNRGLEYIKTLNNNPVIYSLYSEKIIINMKLKNYLKAIDIANEYFSSKNNEIGTDLEIYYMKAESYYFLERYNDSIRSFKGYLKFYKEFKKGLHNTLDTFQHAVGYANELFFKKAILFISDSYIEINDFKNALSYLQLININDFTNDKDKCSYWLNLEFELMKKTKSFSRVTLLYQKIDDGFALDVLKNLIENGLNDENYRKLILKEFISLKSKDDYQKLNKLRLDYYNGNITAPAVEKFIKSVEDFSFQYADAVYLGLKLNFSIRDIASKINGDDLNKYFLNNGYYHFNDLPSILFNRYKNRWDDLDTNSQMFLSYLYFIELNSGELNEEYAVDLFNEYSKITYCVLKEVLGEEILNEDTVCLLSQNYKVGYYSNLAVIAREDGQNSQYLKYIEKVSKLNPQFNNVIKILIGRLENSINNNALSEFNSYAIQVKAAIKNMIDNKNIKEAEDILNEYEALCPNDQEIAVLKSQINSIKI